MTTFQLTTRAALERAWRNLTHATVFERHSIWVMFIDAEDRPVGPVLEVEDAVHPPEVSEIAPFADFLAEMAPDVGDPACRVAMLRSRPGGGPPTAQDHDWATALYAAARRAGLATELVHFASADHLVAVAPDGVTVLPLSA